jgi:hypothetical protein
MTEQLNREFTKKVIFLPDGRQLIYYNFAPQTQPEITVTTSQRERERR